MTNRFDPAEGQLRTSTTTLIMKFSELDPLLERSGLP